MPWKVSVAVNERMKLVMRIEQGERISEVCRDFGVSRKTGYKFLDRYQKYGPKGLYDGSRRPITSPSVTPPQILTRILELKDHYPTWGARKLHEVLKSKHETALSVATIHRILVKNNKVIKKPRRRKGEYNYSTKPFASKAPNDIWCIDFKGQFKTSDNRLCYPLTLSDHFSRYLISCEALENTSSQPVLNALEIIFKENGLPNALLSDNGCPFGAPKGLFGLSRLSIWLLKLRIEVLRIEPGHPEQNGRHERMHLTLKKETTRPAANNLLQQQELFDRFKKQYNEERPHEALKMKTPESAWVKPIRKYPNNLDPIQYPTHDITCNVYKNGQVMFKNRKQIFFLSAAFANENIGLREEEEQIWRVSFADYDLGFLDEKEMKFSPLERLTLNDIEKV